MADWIEVSLSVDGEAAEAVAEVLNRYGHQGVAIEQEGIVPETWDEGETPSPTRLTVRAYIPADERAEEAKLKLEQALGYMNLMYPMPAPVYQIVHEEDWAEAWKAHYHPVRVGQRIFIRPLWVQVEAQPNDVVLSLDPGMAFGTGTHPTTQLCLEALETTVRPGIKVLDLGCGSGILGIAAVKLGAAQVLGLDTDPMAVRVTEENSAQNGVSDKIIAQQGSLETVVTSARRFDLIVVNILARVIIAMCAEHLGDVVRPGGLAIFSGIIEEQAADVEAALRKTGLEPYQRRQQGDWVVIEARRPHES
ncbi:MAG: 50S ribosomal protein L11 methyltransferase [Anaerolineae bacterium]|nr:50S ribosomal protein L11 methyltransferase [Anaerolineae bacterium]